MFVATAENPYQAGLTNSEPTPLGARANKALELVDRLGIARYTILLTAGATVASLAICLLAYSLIGFDPLKEPISILLPVLCPLLIAPTMTVSATRTALKLREQQRYIAEQNLKLERILTEKDRIISLVGHDLRGQLNLVMGFSQLISRQADTMPPERLVDYANEIHLAGSKTNDVLNDLLNWGRARAGHLSAGHETDPFNDIVARVVDGLKLEAERKDVTIARAVSLPDDEIDRVIVASALRNLLSNAIKFSHAGGVVNVEARRTDGHLQFTVTDTGIGMSLEQLSRLRDGHLIISTEGTSREIGSGLGLAICRDVIEAQGGGLEIDSEQGKGTRVTVAMPLG
jgi:signal transduction histidine kinase